MTVFHLTKVCIREYTKAYYNRGNAYSELGEYKQAISDYTRAIELDPEYAEAYYNRGLAYKQLGNCSAANSDFLEAYTISGDIIYKDTCP